jgi:hypothetical protein
MRKKHKIKASKIALLSLATLIMIMAILYILQARQGVSSQSYNYSGDSSKQNISPQGYHFTVNFGIQKTSK